MDWFAVASNGTFPAPASTSTQRAAYGASYGLLSLVPEGDASILGGVIMTANNLLRRSYKSVSLMNRHR